MADLRTNYVDDILDTSTNERRKYRMITNDDGTVSFIDVTDYSQIGDSFGSNDLNAITNAVNENTSSIEQINVDISVLNEELGAKQSILSVLSKTVSVTIPASNAKVTTISVSRDGYTAIGIVGIHLSTTNNALGDFYLINNTTAQVYVRNLLSTDATIDIRLNVLYKKN